MSPSRSHSRFLPYRSLVALLAALAGSPFASAADDPLALLERAERAMRENEVAGELVYIHDGRVEALRVERSNGAEGLRERLVMLTGDRREIVREGDEIRCSQPGVSTVVDALPVLQMLTPASSAAPYYTMSVVGSDRVAGLDAVVVEARPRDESRYGYRLWLDRDSGVLLASALNSATGVPIEQVMFTSIQLRPVVAAEPAAAVDAAGPASAEPLAPAEWQIDGLPEGFRLVATPQTSGGPRHLVYSDGMANVSVYIEPLATSGAPLVAELARGAVHVVGRTIGGHQIVVVGDLPAPSIERIATSVVRR